MANLDDLIEQVTEPALRAELGQAVGDLRRRKTFGLVFEEHIPEITLLRDVPVKVGATVYRRDDMSAKTPLTVTRVDTNTATVVTTAGHEIQEPVERLLVLRRFGDPIYPTLLSIDTVERGGDRPYHAVIEGENFHALQLLRFMHAGEVDCIYIDPPYNTGARDWKYNNDYVDRNDRWRHSKWLSMMEKRLRLAKRLLKPDGVLIVTIDENEVHHLGMLLEQIFPRALRQMVTIVNNPKGVTQGRLSRVEEYAIFCFLGDATLSGVGDDLLSPQADEPDVGGSPRWKGLLRSGDEAARADRKDMFYPVLIDPDRGAVVGAGEPLPAQEAPDFDARSDGCIPVWPVRRDGSLGRWSVGRATLRQLIEKGYVALGSHQPSRRTWAISYLSKQLQDQVDAGVLVVRNFDEERNVVDVRYTDPRARRIKTVWHRSSHDAGAYGTDLLGSFLGARVFPFPKSLLHKAWRPG